MRPKWARPVESAADWPKSCVTNVRRSPLIGPNQPKKFVRSPELGHRHKKMTARQQDDARCFLFKFDEDCWVEILMAIEVLPLDFQVIISRGRVNIFVKLDKDIPVGLAYYLFGEYTPVWLSVLRNSGSVKRNFDLLLHNASYIYPDPAIAFEL